MTRTVNDRFDRLIEFQRGKLSDANTDGTPANRTHNSQNQITSGGLGYDDNGNLNAAGDTDYKYDGWNRLVSYDALGRRIVEVIAGVAAWRTGWGKAAAECSCRVLRSTTSATARRRQDSESETEQ